jgi:hypothetical protein
VNGVLTQFIDGTYQPVQIAFPSLTRCNPSALVSLKDVSKKLLEMLEQQKQSLLVKVGGVISDSLTSLAGLLLSYPAIYHSEDTVAQLLDTDVNVISVWTNGSEEKSLMQLSCPLDMLDEVMPELEKTVAKWEKRISQLPPLFREKWRNFTGEELCTLKIQTETRRVPILSL